MMVYINKGFKFTSFKLYHIQTFKRCAGSHGSDGNSNHIVKLLPLDP